MRQDNEVNGERSGPRSHVINLLRARLIATPRRAAVFGLAAAVGTSALLLSTTHDTANAEMAKAAAVTTAVTKQAAERTATTKSTKDSATRSTARSAKPAATGAKAAPTKTVKKAAAPVALKPVAGLNATQMRNAAIIVKAGRELGVPTRGQIVAVATAMQESNLYNRASYVVPESLKYKHEGTGADYDSVGLFQQRYTTGWGSVKSIMNPSESAKKFYRALMRVGGWQRLPVTVAAQTVQGSAFPNAYAKHTGRAAVVVRAVNAAR